MIGKSLRYECGADSRGVGVLSLFAKDGRFDVLALAPDRDCLPDPERWSLKLQDAIDRKRLMLDQQRAVQEDGFILGA
jgi:hypothetical protein